MNCKKCDKIKKKNSQIAKLKREVHYHVMCRLGDIEYSDGGKKLMEEFDDDYKFLWILRGSVYNMNIYEAMQNLKEKFTSGNDIPVERNTITREEYEIIYEMFSNYLMSKTSCKGQ